MAMLAVLCAFVPKERLFCVHVEHGLRPAEESLGDAGFVADFCETHKINCHVASIPPGKIASYARQKKVGIEAAARFFRRKAIFKEAARLSLLCGEKPRILVAHTKDDLLETALMRVLRGAGPAGLAAMPVNRGRILRPLLSMSRDDVIRYLKEKNIPWREDSTNTDEKFLRNRIRHKLIPMLNDFFPSWKRGLVSLARTQSLTAAFLEEEARRRFIWTREESGLVCDAENFFSQPVIIREEALFQGVDLLLKGKESFIPKRSVIRRFCAGSITSADLGRLRISQKNGKVFLSAVMDFPCETGFSLLIKEAGQYILDNVTIDVCQSAEKDGEEGFYAALPLIFRRSVKDGFSVKDEFVETNGGQVYWVTIRGANV